MSTRVVHHHLDLPAYMSSKTTTMTSSPGTAPHPIRRYTDILSLRVLRSYKPLKTLHLPLRIHDGTRRNMHPLRITLLGRVKKLPSLEH